ncbi:DUF1294 domain-containing protein [[Clostridium] polysaccharolyticum]|uniref:Uncharacterized membrane protein YsdA, DUF1294 family n=1 Tax=[Clostridium] polysaccharolyticum TaxID=29364 RepID=A0A1I0DWQ7_9FIRM|nr:DUF1294 domain-containing protein [[Clostridium] polysaccharolyticum]SET36944.1 Uncharacterized membrane protein YsdA, DUF1294 family [[Clostridium] polysaccharolyticum]
MENVKYFIAGYVLLINLIGYYSMWSDKRKAKKGAWRTPESTLIMIAVLGGSLGSLMGMKKFRHKTKHLKFYVGIPVILVVQVVLAWSGIKFFCC